MNNASQQDGADNGVGSTGGSAFLAWFEEQAGKPTHDESEYLRLRHETLPALRRALAEKEAELAECERYRTAKQYALYAWCAKDSPNTQGLTRGKQP